MRTLDSKAVAEMLGKRHDNFMRDVRKYVATLGEAAPEYFIEGTYKDGLGKTRAGYQITLKGCEYIAGRVIGVKSEEFKSKYLQMFPEAHTEPVESPKPEAVQGYSTEEVAQLLRILVLFSVRERAVRSYIFWEQSTRSSLWMMRITAVIKRLMGGVIPVQKSSLFSIILRIRIASVIW